MAKDRPPPALAGSLEKVAEVAKDLEQAGLVVRRTIKKAEANRDQLFRGWDDLMALCRLLAAWSKREYRAAPWRTLTLALGVVIYFLNPLDAVPDFIPGGLLDDISLIMLTYKIIKGDVDKFLVWEETEKRRV